MVKQLASVESQELGWRGVVSPWALGLYGLAGATFLLATRMAGWDGLQEQQFLLVPFSTALGGLALLAAIWAFATRESLATVVLGIWGSFWIAHGVLAAMLASGKLVEPGGVFPELGVWYAVLAAVTWVCAVAALSESAALVVTLGFLAAGATVAAVANIGDRGGLEMLAGWLFIVSALFAWYTATATLFAKAFGRPLLPLGSCTSTPESAARAERTPAPDQAPAPGRVG
jgi:succinate-acetate transporter protein